MTSRNPDIRFDGYTDNWEHKKLGNITSSYSGGTPTAGNNRYYNGDIPFIRSGEINSSFTKLFITGEGLNNSSAKLVKKGDILYALYGATSGEVGLSKINGAINQAVLVIKPTSGDDSYLITQWLRKQKRTIIGTYLQGGQGNLSGGIVKKLIVTLPNDKYEQIKIGKLFKQFDENITLHQHALDLLKQRKKAFLQKMFPKKGQSVPNIRFPEFTEQWTTKMIGDIFTVTRGKVLAFKEVKRSKSIDCQYPVYSSQTKNNGLLGFYNEYLFDTAITWTTDGANAGTVNFRESKFYSTNVNGVLLSDEGYTNKAVAEILNKVAWRHVSKVGNPKLMNNIMSKIKISLPSIAEQKEIGNFFNQIDDSITLQEEKIESLKQMKKAFLQKMFV